MESQAGKDSILRATGEIAELRFVVVDATESANTILAQHGAGAHSQILLGDAVAAALLLASGLKGNGTVQASFRFSGDIAFVTADATPMGLVRGMIPAPELAKAGDYELLLSPQTVSVRKLDERGACYNEGIVEMPVERIGPSTAFYLLQSEQTRSAVGIRSQPRAGAKGLDFCAGFLVEAFPKADEKTLRILEQVVAGLPDWGTFRRPEGGVDAAALLDALAGPFQYRIHREIPVQAYCPCSEKGVRKALAALGEEELQDMLLRNETAELFCDYCRKRYLASPAEIEDILGELRGE